MIYLLIAFFASFIATLVIIRTQKLHGAMSADHNLDGPQKFHTKAVPRIGGLAIGLGLYLAIAFEVNNYAQLSEEAFFVFCSLPTFLIGLTEDITKNISVRVRLIFTAISALLAVVFLGAEIHSLDIPFLDYIFVIPGISIIFTIFAITGLANAFNIIDGFNGLSSMVGIISLVALGYMGIQFGDSLIIFLSFTMAASILGFFIWNYPRGLIFLGDGGAYLVGFWIATLSVMIVCRHEQISPWFALMLNAYPILETLFTIYRRKFHQGKSPGHPDGIHFHSLIFRRILNRASRTNEANWFSANAKTSPYLWILSSLAAIPAILFWNSSNLLICFFTLFTVTYVWLYKRVVSFQTPGWLKI